MIKISAVQLVRDIRDRQYEETKNKTPQELKDYFEEKAKWAFSANNNSAHTSIKK